MSDPGDAAERVIAAVPLAARDHGTLAAIGIHVSNIIKQTLSHAGSGRTYRRGGAEHQASAPGEPPAVDSGRLRNSIDYAVGADGDGGYVEVGTSVEYAPYLEYGTSKMEARPFMRPSVAAATPGVEQLFGKKIDELQRAVVASLPREIQLPE